MSNKAQNMVEAVIIFVDVRGFTSWAEKVDVFPYLNIFTDKFYQILNEVFKDYTIKTLGDGALLIKKLPESESIDLNLQKLIKEIIKKIDRVEKKFKKMCCDLSKRHGSSIPLSLGWGVTKGWIKPLNGDFIGAEINKCARLCDIARPKGIVIDKDDFPILPKLPKSIDIEFFEQKRKLRGLLYEIDVWVSKEIANQFFTREDVRLTPEVHIAGLCIKEEEGEIKALIAKRSNSRKLFPGLYEGCGGQLDSNETFVEGVKRHYKLELNIDVEVLEDIHKFYCINYPSEPKIPGIKFLCLYKGGTPKSENHTEIKWVTEEELKKIPDKKFIPALKQDFIQFIHEFKKKNVIP
ncbi:hypothetical protein JCM12298_29010 [Desulfothermus naphthae]